MPVRICRPDRSLLGGADRPGLQRQRQVLGEERGVHRGQQEGLERQRVRGVTGRGQVLLRVREKLIQRQLVLAAQGAALVDPLCGSGTLPIEAALIAADCAPGLEREHFGFMGWRGLEPDIWKGLLAEARERRRALEDCLVGLDVPAAVLGIDDTPEEVLVRPVGPRRSRLATPARPAATPLTTHDAAW